MSTYIEDKPQVTLQERHNRFMTALRELMKAHGVDSITLEEDNRCRIELNLWYNYRNDYPGHYVLEGGTIELDEIRAMQ